MDTDFFTNPAFPRAVVIGVLGGAALGLTVFYSRRGPMIFLPYAALLAALTFLLARYADLSFATRFTAALSGFAIATAFAYVAVGVTAERQRERLRCDGRLPSTASGPSVWGHAWRIGFVLSLGSLASAAVAFIAS